MSTARNFYKLLGVQSTADNKSIKKAYKKLALRHHPDRSNNASQSATDKWNEILTAYEVLKDPHKRKIYDQYGEKGLKKNGLFPNINDLFDMVFAEYGDEDDMNEDIPMSDGCKPDIVSHVRVSITLAESYTGTKKMVSFVSAPKCSMCDGKGTIREDTECGQCHGKKYTKNWKGTRKQCDACTNGYIIRETACYECAQSHGHGQQAQKVNKSVTIAPGTSHGDIIRVNCCGGQLEVRVTVVKENSNPYSVLGNGTDLVMIQPIEISARIAQAGGDVIIPHFTGGLLVKRSGNSIKNDVLYKIRGKGMVRKGTKSRGDLFVKFRIVSNNQRNNTAQKVTNTVQIQELNKWDMLSFSNEDQVHLKNNANVNGNNGNNMTDTKRDEQEQPPDCKQM